ncbi:S9 family peptidase [Paramuricea clavata]|uniref:Prolyl endopeptidase n=1 Tax=Paramuricea clavata TaxID=317549 RepID=A0A7D9IG83_PARCT|nr:S9 family peptidase [Paramuricea clavata]
MDTIDTGFVSHMFPRFSPSGDKIYCIAGSTTRPYCVIEVHVESKHVVIIKDTKHDEVDPGYISEPKAVTYPTEDNKVAHGYLYLPKNKDYAAPPGSLPPLLVKVHGGPTSSTLPNFDLNKQFFTSRGVAILDVNYRGSTGYGMHYRKELYGNWGKVDVEDCCNGALYVANSMKAADREKLCIDGGSAGGYTTLACLTQRNEVFKAGASMFGVSDVEALVKETHKFESRYIDSMIGPYPECKELYKERSPVNHVDKLNCPMIFFQGDEDKIVLPNQAEMMFNAVKEKGIPCCYVLYEGEQHGFRKSENIIATLEGEFCFFAKVFGYEPADIECKLNIENLESVQR